MEILNKKNKHKQFMILMLLLLIINISNYYMCSNTYCQPIEEQTIAAQNFESTFQEISNLVKNSNLSLKEFIENKDSYSLNDVILKLRDDIEKACALKIKLTTTHSENLRLNGYNVYQDLQYKASDFRLLSIEKSSAKMIKDLTTIIE